MFFPGRSESLEAKGRAVVGVRPMVALALMVCELPNLRRLTPGTLKIKRTPCLSSGLITVTSGGRGLSS